MNKLKMLSLSTLFCAFLTVQEVAAQSRWIKVDNNNEIDTNVQRTPNGNLKYWERFPSLQSEGDFDEILMEVNCVTRQSRTLMIKRADSYGNVKVIRSIPEDWREEDGTIQSDNNRRVCSSNPREINSNPRRTNANEPFMSSVDDPNTKDKSAPAKVNTKKKTTKQSRRSKKKIG
jgi:hypothetical protein